MKIYIITLLWPLAFLVNAHAASADNPAAFHQRVIALQQQQLAGHQVRSTEEQGTYEGAAGRGYRYIDTRYYDTASGNLLSHVRRDASNAELVHIVEVNIFEQGRLERDFGSITLPWSPLHPVRTFINLHQYNDALHSFRQYDYYGEVGYEFCEGKLAGSPVHISLDDTDINTASTASIAYKACFNGISKDWAQYKNPH
jgi:hypothetical protein